MNKKRRMLFRIGAVALLIVIGAIMMVIGRGHTVYLDNKTLEYNGQTYEMPYKIEVVVDGEQVAKLYGKGAGERGSATNIGQSFHMTLVVTQEKGGGEETVDVALKLPYSMDGVAINLPAYLAGLPEEAYLTQFVPTPAAEESAEEEVATDEFGVTITDETAADLSAA